MGEKLASLLKQQSPKGLMLMLILKIALRRRLWCRKRILLRRNTISPSIVIKRWCIRPEYEDPKVILKRLKDLEKEILADLDELEGML
jgi:type I restriction enzyme M protein